MLKLFRMGRIIENDLFEWWVTTFKNYGKILNIALKIFLTILSFAKSMIIYIKKFKKIINISRLI